MLPEPMKSDYKAEYTALIDARNAWLRERDCPMSPLFPRRLPRPFTVDISVPSIYGSRTSWLTSLLRITTVVVVVVVGTRTIPNSTDGSQAA